MRSVQLSIIIRSSKARIIIYEKQHQNALKV